jgi:hypothetical protein
MCFYRFFIIVGEGYWMFLELLDLVYRVGDWKVMLGLSEEFGV